MKEIGKAPILLIEKDENGVIINAKEVLLNRIERGDITLELYGVGTGVRHLSRKEFFCSALSTIHME